MPADEQRSDDQGERKAVRINRIVPSDMRATFANHFVVRHTPAGDEFVLSCFEIMPPIFIDEEDVQGVDSVDAHCVAQIVMTGEKMGLLIAALAENFTKSRSRLESSKGSKDGESSKTPAEGKKHVG